LKLIQPARLTSGGGSEFNCDALAKVSLSSLVGHLIYYSFQTLNQSLFEHGSGLIRDVSLIALQLNMQPTAKLLFTKVPNKCPKIHVGCIKRLEFERQFHAQKLAQKL